MFNFFKKKEKEKQEFVFSNLEKVLGSRGLWGQLQNSWLLNFTARSKALKIPEEEIEKSLQKIILDLKNSDIEFIWKAFTEEYHWLEYYLYLKFRIWKYFLYLNCSNTKDDYVRINGNSLESLKLYSQTLEQFLNIENNFVIFDDDLKAFRKIIFDYWDCYLVFWDMYLELWFLEKYKFLGEQVTKYINRFWKIILNKNLLKISEIETKELEEYLKNIKIIWVEGMNIEIEFAPVFQQAKRLIEITDEIKNLNREIQDIRSSAFEKLFKLDKKNNI